MTNRMLNDERLQLLARVLDLVIPPSPDGGKPGAGELGLADQLAAGMADDAMMAAMIGAGLDKIEQLAGPDGLAKLDPSQRQSLLEKANEEVPGLVPFLTFRVYTLYYQDNRVLEALGLEPRPPHPVGYEMEPFDESLLAPVRGRAKLYRTTERGE